jgi:hypothetical protein
MTQNIENKKEEKNEEANSKYFVRMYDIFPADWMRW